MKILPLLASSLLLAGLLAAPAFADDVNVKARPLPNETAIPGTVAVNLICTIQMDASVNNCKVADGDKASQFDAASAVAAANGKMHVAGAFVAGYPTHLKVVLNVGHALPLLPIR